MEYLKSFIWNSPNKNEQELTPEYNRDQWASKWDFLITCIGYAVGLGNVWRFPYLVYEHGGAAFLIPYTISAFCIGLPLYYLELSVGQFASLGPISVWNVSPLFRGIGYASVAMASVLAIYYPVILSYCFYYLVHSFYFTGLPWSRCDGYWNAITCETNMSNMPDKTLPEEEFYKIKMLGGSNSIENFGWPQWQLLICFIFIWINLMIVLCKSIKSFGKTIYFFTLLPYAMLTILLVYGLTLDGSLNGIKFYCWTFDYTKILNVKVWIAAATQIFFSLATCTGGIITLASYNKFNNNSCRDALVVVGTNCLTSIYAGFAIFSNLGYLAHVKNVPVKDVVTSGFGLAFIVYPTSISSMPGSNFWAIAFFFMMTCLGFSSQISIFEGVLAGFQDELTKIQILKSPKHNVIYRIIVCGLFFLFGLPILCPGGFYLMGLLDEIYGSFPLTLIAVCETLTICYIYGINNFLHDVQIMENRKPNLFWKIMWMSVTPLLCFLLSVTSMANLQTTISNYPLGWRVVANLLAFLAPFLILFVFIYQFLASGGYIFLCEMLKPEYTWGPAAAQDRDRFLIDLEKRECTSIAMTLGKSELPKTVSGSTADLFFQNKLTVADKLTEVHFNEIKQNKL